MKKANEVLYRLSPYLVMYWQRGQLVFENYAERVRISAAPITFEILKFFHGWRSCESLYRGMRGFSEASVQRAVAALVDHSFLQRSDQVTATDQAMQEWAHWNPAAGLFHFSTKDGSYDHDPQATLRRLRRRARKHPIPAALKRYPQVRQFKLPEPTNDSEFTRILLTRRTWRRFSKRSMQLSQLGTLLGLTWGVQRWIELPGLSSVALKSSPSGGALHPIEAYVVALRVAGLPRGIYHYASDAHRLELLRPGTTSKKLVSYLTGQWWFRPAGAVVFMTAVFPRTQWKYESPRAYRVVLAEAGHFCQTFCLVATWLGLAPFSTMALADSRIEKDLGIDGITESVLYAAGVGTRLRGVDWTPEPELPATG